MVEDETWNTSENLEDRETCDTRATQTTITNSQQETMKAISASVASLLKISILVRHSTDRDDYAKAASRFSEWSSFSDIGHVREKYGRAQQSQLWLLERLGRAITRRRQFLKYRTDHHEKTSRVPEDVGVREIDLQSRLDKTLGSTHATTLLAKPELQNDQFELISNVALSEDSQTSYDPTTFGHDDIVTKRSVPPPPKDAFPGIEFEYGEPFMCPYCFTEQIVKHRTDWK